MGKGQKLKEEKDKKVKARNSSVLSFAFLGASHDYDESGTGFDCL